MVVFVMSIVMLHLGKPTLELLRLLNKAQNKKCWFIKSKNVFNWVDIGKFYFPIKICHYFFLGILLLAWLTGFQTPN